MYPSRVKIAAMLVMFLVAGGMIWIVNDQYTYHGGQDDETAEEEAELEKQKEYANYRNLIADLQNRSLKSGVGYSTSLFEMDKTLYVFHGDDTKRVDSAVADMKNNGAEFNSEDILSKSGMYADVLKQIREDTEYTDRWMDNLSKELTVWNTDVKSEGKMDVAFKYGMKSVSSVDSVAGHLVIATNVISENNSVAYLGGGEIWVFGGSSTITSSSGWTLILPPGCTDLDKVSGFKAGIYDLQSGRQYAGQIMHTTGLDSVDVKSGLVMEAGHNIKLAIYSKTADMFATDGFAYRDLTVSITPINGQTYSTDISEVVKMYEELIESAKRCLVTAESYAAGIWHA